MKPRLNLLILLLSISVVTLFAQNYEIEWSEEQKIVGKDYNTSYLRTAVMDNYYYVLKTAGSNKRLFIYTLEHQLIEERKINFEADGLNMVPISFYNTSHAMFVLFKATNMNPKGICYYVKALKDNNELGKPLMIYRNENFYRSVTSRVNHLKFTQSPDGTKIAFIYWQPEAPLSMDNVKYSITVLNDRFEKLWHREQEMPYKKHYWKQYSVEINNQSEIFIVDRKTYSLSRKSTAKYYGGYRVNYITKYQAVHYEWYIGDDVKVRNMRLVDKKDGTIFLAGFYGTNKKRGGLLGMYLTSIDKTTGEILDVKRHPFSEEVLTQMAMMPSRVTKGKGVQKWFALYQEKYWGDGVYSISADSAFESIMENSEFRSHSLISFFNADGELLDVVHIDKGRGFKTKMFSYNFFQDNHLYMVYNASDHIMLNVINSDADIIHNQAIANFNESKEYCQLSKITYKNDCMILPVKKSNNRYRFGRLRLD